MNIPWSFRTKRGYNWPKSSTITWDHLPVKRINAGICATASFVAASLLCSGLALGQERVASDLMFSIAGEDIGIAPVIMEPTAVELVGYNLSTGEVRFSVGNITTGVYDDPLFCFGAPDNDSPVRLRVTDANDHLVIDNFGLSSSLYYVLNNQEIAIQPPWNARCFYKGGDGTFGLFGKAFAGNGIRSDLDPEDSILTDGFIGYPDLSVTYVNLPSSISTDGLLEYTLRIENSGNVTAKDVAFQEVFPANSSVYAATLSDGNWNCFNAACPQSSGSGPLRFEGMEIPPGGFVNFEIRRTVPDDLTIVGEIINLYAGVVSGYGSYAQFDTAQRAVDILGPPDGLAFEAQPSDTVTGELISPAVVVNVVDVNGNRVTTDNLTQVRIELRDDAGGIIWDLAPYESVVEGQVEFDQLSMGDVIPGIYTLIAWPDDWNMDARQSAPFEVLSAP